MSPGQQRAAQQISGGFERRANEPNERQDRHGGQRDQQQMKKEATHQAPLSGPKRKNLNWMNVSASRMATSVQPMAEA